MTPSAVVLCQRRLTQLSSQHKFPLPRHLTGLNVHGFPTHCRPRQPNGHPWDQQRPGQLLLIANRLQNDKSKLLCTGGHRAVTNGFWAAINVNRMKGLLLSVLFVLSHVPSTGSNNQGRRKQ